MWTELPTSSCVASDGDRSRTSQPWGTAPTGSRRLEARRRATGGGQGRGDGVQHTRCTHTREAVGHPATCWQPRGAPPPPALCSHITSTPSALPRADATLGKRDSVRQLGTGVCHPRWRDGLPREPFTCFLRGRCPGTYRNLSNSGEYFDLALKITCNDRKTWQVGGSTR